MYINMISGNFTVATYRIKNYYDCWIKEKLKKFVHYFSLYIPILIILPLINVVLKEARSAPRNLIIVGLPSVFFLYYNILIGIIVEQYLQHM